jgi:ceroid-lipofuscinosis MFS transporter 7
METKSETRREREKENETTTLTLSSSLSPSSVSFFSFLSSSPLFLCSSSSQTRVVSGFVTSPSLSSSVYVIGYVSFLGDMARGVVFPVLWHLCQALGGQTTNFGYLIAIFSFGRMVFGPVLGYICDRYSHKLSLFVASALLVFGGVAWSFTYLLNHIWYLYLAQFLLGCGSGSLGVTRAYIVESFPTTQNSQRLTEILAYMNALQFAGFTVSPILGSGLSYLGTKLNSSFLEYFFPSISISFAALLSLYLLIFTLEDIKPTTEITTNFQSINRHLLSATQEQQIIENEDVELQNMTRNYSSSLDANSDATLLANIPSSSPVSAPFYELSDSTIAYLILILCNIIARGSIAVYETMTPKLAESLYSMPVTQLGVIISTMGAVGTCQLVFFKKIWTPTGLNDIHLTTIGLFVMAISSYIIFDYEAEMVSFFHSSDLILFLE